MALETRRQGQVSPRHSFKTATKRWRLHISHHLHDKSVFTGKEKNLLVDWFSKSGVYQSRSRGACRQLPSIIGWAKMLPGRVVLLLPVLLCSGTALSNVGTPLQTNPLTLQPDANLFHWTSTTLAIAPEEVLLPKMLQKMWVRKPSYRPKVKIF